MSKNEMPQNAIELTTAVEWVERWRATSETPPVKGFLIPHEDINSIMGEAGYVNYRAYMGTQLVDNEPVYHLLIVGVDASGNDMVDESRGQYVYDFTHPCPATCSATGPLK